MKIVYNDELKVNEIELEETDICYTCNIDNKCPLLSAIQWNVVYPATNDMNIKFCEIKA